MLAPGARDEYLQSRADVASRDDAPMAELFPKAQEFERMFVEAGGLLAAGVDPTGMGGALPGYGDQRNYELLLESGFSPEQVIPDHVAERRPRPGRGRAVRLHRAGQAGRPRRHRR